MNMSKKEPIYIDANILLGHARKRARKDRTKYKRKTEIKTGVLENLHQEYLLITSILTRYEVIKNLIKTENINLKEARKIYNSILEDFKIMELTVDKRKKSGLRITYNFIEDILKAGVSFKDGIHILFALHYKLHMVTGNKNHINLMKKLYSEIYLPKEKLKK